MLLEKRKKRREIGDVREQKTGTLVEETKKKKSEFHF
jgi:hypothetical protein